MGNTNRPTALFFQKHGGPKRDAAVVREASARRDEQISQSLKQGQPASSRKPAATNGLVADLRSSCSCTGWAQALRPEPPPLARRVFAALASAPFLPPAPRPRQLIPHLEPGTGFYANHALQRLTLRWSQQPPRLTLPFYRFLRRNCSFESYLDFFTPNHHLLGQCFDQFPFVLQLYFGPHVVEGPGFVQYRFHG